MSHLVVKICNNGEKDCYFYSDNLLHREEGPAIILNAGQDDLLKLKDGHLYKKETIEAELPPNYSAKFLLESTPIPNTNTFEGKIIDATYYLRGEAYTEEEFIEAKAKIDLKNDLSSELSLNNNHTKKPKV